MWSSCGVILGGNRILGWRTDCPSSLLVHKVVRDAGWLASTHSRSFPKTLKLQGADWQAVYAKPSLQTHERRAKCFPGLECNLQRSWYSLRKKNRLEKEEGSWFQVPVYFELVPFTPLSLPPPATTIGHMTTAASQLIPPDSNQRDLSQM